MKTKLYFPIIALCVVLFSGCANKAQNVNPVAPKNTVSTTKYNDLSPEILLRQAYAHYDLDQFIKSKEKINVILQQHPDTPEAVDAESFLVTIDKRIQSAMLSKEEKRSDSLREERQKRLPKAVEKMHKSTSSNGLTHFIDRSSPKFDTKECFYAYFTKGVGAPQLFFKIQYVASTWLNIENYIITVDQKDYTLKDTIYKEETKGKKKLIKEILDTPIDTREKMEALRAIANGKTVTAAYVGESSYKKRDITEEQRIAIRNVLDAYEFFGGTAFDL